MRTLFTLMTLFGALHIGAQETYTDKNGNQHLWGGVQLEDLRQAPYKDWFESQYRDYQPSVSGQFIGTNLEDLTVKVFLGTWCGDTKYLVPRFVKLWEALELDTKALTFVALHNKGQKYKQGPNGEEKGLNIHRVPTFIFEREGVEVARIVERTLNSLETDLFQIANDCPSEPRYRVVSYLHEQLQSKTAEELREDLSNLSRRLYREVSNAGELNTYGYVLKAAGKYDLAKLVFELNVRLFPYEPNVYDSLGEFFVTVEEYKEAEHCYKKVLGLKPNDENATKMLGIIAQKITNANGD